MVDIAFKVIGIGSVGTRCFVVLLLAEDGDPLILQVKEARHSVLEPFAGAGPYEQQGRRVVEGQRLTQAASEFSSAGSRTKTASITTCASSGT